jgi:beta-phosphoglucomutase-like phosphatase (HAD superfamily)
MLLIFDMDGTVVDSMPALTNLAIDLMQQYLRMDRDVAEREYRRTTGLPFLAQLQDICPRAQPEALRNIAEIYTTRHYALAPSFPLAPQAERLFRWLRSMGQQTLKNEDAVYFGDAPQDEWFAQLACIPFQYAEAAHLDAAIFQVLGEPR